MPAAKTLNERDAKLVSWLGEAHAKEAELEADLTAHIGLTEKPAYKKRLQTTSRRRAITSAASPRGSSSSAARPARAFSPSRAPSARSPARPSPRSRDRWGWRGRS